MCQGEEEASGWPRSWEGGSYTAISSTFLCHLLAPPWRRCNPTSSPSVPGTLGTGASEPGSKNTTPPSSKNIPGQSNFPTRQEAACLGRGGRVVCTQSQVQKLSSSIPHPGGLLSLPCPLFPPPFQTFLGHPAPGGRGPSAGLTLPTPGSQSPRSALGIEQQPCPDGASSLNSAAGRVLLCFPFHNSEGGTRLKKSDPLLGHMARKLSSQDSSTSRSLSCRGAQPPLLCPRGPLEAWLHTCGRIRGVRCTCVPLLTGKNEDQGRARMDPQNTLVGGVSRCGQKGRGPEAAWPLGDWLGLCRGPGLPATIFTGSCSTAEKKQRASVSSGCQPSGSGGRGWGGR